MPDVQTPHGVIRFVNNTDDVPKMIDVICGAIDVRRVFRTTERSHERPALYMDVEGRNLGLHGTVTILQIHVLPAKTTYVIDIWTLGIHAFWIRGVGAGCSMTLSAILQARSIPKVLFDVRNDAAGLKKNYGVLLDGITDLQVMEIHTRPLAARRLYNGLKLCMDLHATISPAEKAQFRERKNHVQALYAREALDPEYGVFQMRPIEHDILMYCAQDAHILPELWLHYHQRLSVEERDIVYRETDQRLHEVENLGHWPNINDGTTFYGWGPGYWHCLVPVSEVLANNPTLYDPGQGT